MDNVERERLAKLEVLVEHSVQKQEEMSAKVNVMYDVLLQVKGAKWFGLVMAGLIGSLLAKADVVIHYLTQGRP